jgi:hypothetical protein
MTEPTLARCSGATGLLRQPLPICVPCLRRRPAKANEITWREWVPSKAPVGWVCSGQRVPGEVA